MKHYLPIEGVFLLREKMVSKYMTFDAITFKTINILMKTQQNTIVIPYIIYNIFKYKICVTTKIIK